jgi:hypothetical protein
MKPAEALNVPGMVPTVDWHSSVKGQQISELAWMQCRLVRLANCQAAFLS